VISASGRDLDRNDPLARVEEHSHVHERFRDDRRLDVVRRGEEKRSQAARLDRHAFPGVASAGRRVGQHSADAALSGSPRDQSECR
jgi:hypothetical protein